MPFSVSQGDSLDQNLKFPFKPKINVISWAPCFYFPTITRSPELSRTLPSSPCSPSPNVSENVLQYWFVLPFLYFSFPTVKQIAKPLCLLPCFRGAVIHKSKDCLQTTWLSGLFFQKHRILERIIVGMGREGGIWSLLKETEILLQTGKRLALADPQIVWTTPSSPSTSWVAGPQKGMAVGSWRGWTLITRLQ